MASSGRNRVLAHYRELLDINRLITSSLDHVVVLATVAKQAARLLEAEAAALLLRDESELKIAAAHNLRERSSELRLPLGPGVMTAISELGRAAGLEGFVGVPLVLRGETIGVLAVYRRMPASSAGEDEELLSALADQAAIALENAHIYDLSLAQTRAVRESEEERFRLALDAAPIGVALVGLDGRLLRVNDALCDILGYSSEQLTELTFQDITHPDDLASDVALAQQLARGQISRYQVAKRYIRKDGKVPTVLLSRSVARNPDGLPLYFITHIEDITERKHAEDLIRQAQERLELALSGANLAAWDWNILTGDVIINPRWAEMRGFRYDEIQPRVEMWRNAIHPDDLPRVQRVLTDCFEGRIAVFESEHRVQTKTGAWIWVLARGKVFARDTKGRPTRMVGTELDITERKRLEHSLRDAYIDLRRAQAVAKTGSWNLDIRRNTALWSEEAYRIFGIPSRTPITYERYLACVHPDDRAYVDRIWATALPGTSYDIEHRIVVGDTVKWLRVKADVELDENGSVSGRFGIMQDITERKQADDAVRLAEAKSSGIVAVSADAIISIDDGQRITLYNEGAAKLFGYSRQEALGASLDLLIPERFHAVHRQHVIKFATGDQAARRMGERDMTILGRRKNGEEFRADAAISKIEVGGTRILTVALRDITEQVRSENEQRFLAEVGTVLAASLEYEDTLTRIAELAVRDLADACLIGIVEDTSELRRVRVVCRESRTRSVGAVIEQRPSDEPFRQLFRETLETRRPVLMREVSSETLRSLLQSAELEDVRCALRAGSIITVPLVAYEKLLGALALVSSTTSPVYRSADVRLAEELARRAALSIENARLYRAARRAIQARDDVLGIVAHDLRTPLNTIGLQAQLVRLSGPESVDQVLKAAEAIERAARRMDRLIEDLLDASRMDVGLFRIEQTRVGAGEVVVDAIEAHRSLATKMKLALELEVQPDLPEVWADRSRLMQVLENLIGNAVKFTQRGGKVSVGAEARANEVQFWVRDTGVGIDAEGLRHVFDRFWQARSDRRGAGLGLAIVKGIVEAHGGRIWVESERGEGTTFYFTMPIVSPLPATTEPSHPQPR